MTKVILSHLSTTQLHIKNNTNGGWWQIRTPGGGQPPMGHERKHNDEGFPPPCCVWAGRGKMDLEREEKPEQHY